MWGPGRWLWSWFWLHRRFGLWQWQLYAKQRFLVGCSRRLLWKTKKYLLIFTLFFFSSKKNIDNCIDNLIQICYHMNLQKCAQETFLNIPLSLETINQGHQLERDVLNHVFMKQEDGDQVTASRKTVIGEQNVFLVQVHSIFDFIIM